MTGSLYKTEAEIARLVGVPLREWASAALVLERKGLPLQDPQFGDRRYWPAVKAFLDRRAGLAQNAAPLAPDGGEDHDFARQSRARARA